jgi:hypothetical protein
VLLIIIFIILSDQGCAEIDVVILKCDHDCIYELDKISENGGEIVYKDSSFIKAIFLENKIEQAVKSFFEITERRNQKAELSGGTQLTVFQT